MLQMVNESMKPLCKNLHSILCEAGAMLKNKTHKNEYTNLSMNGWYRHRGHSAVKADFSAMMC